MFASRHPSFRHRPASCHARLLLVLGVFALFMHSLAGMGLMGSHAGSNGKFVAEICTALGISPDKAITTAIGNMADNDSPPANGNAHDCCKLCVASAPLLLADTPLAVSPEPTFRITLAPPPPTRPASPVWTAHPPRGPPPSV